MNEEMNVSEVGEVSATLEQVEAAGAPRNAQEATNLVVKYLLQKVETVQESLHSDSWTQGQRNRIDRAKAELVTRLQKRIKQV